MQSILRIAGIGSCVVLGAGFAIALAVNTPDTKPSNSGTGKASGSKTDLTPPGFARLSASTNLNPRLVPAEPDRTRSAFSPRPNGNQPVLLTPSTAQSPVSMPAPAQPVAQAPQSLHQPTYPLVVPYHSAITQQVEDLKGELQTLRKQKSDDERSLIEMALDVVKNQNAKSATSVDEVNKVLKGMNGNAAQPSLGTPTDRQTESLPPPTPRDTSAAVSNAITDIRRGEGDHDLELNLRDSDLRQVLDILSEQTGLNILASPNVKGSVTATLKGVNAMQALKAILKASGFVSRTEGSFIFVGMPEEVTEMATSKDKLSTRIFYPNYVKAAELQTLIAPLLTPTIGKISVCTPAEIDIAADNTHTGGDGFAGGEVLLIRDYEAVLWQVEQIIQDVDKRPKQVSIEAMIISVRLSDKQKMGVDFQALRDKANVRLFSGNPLNDLAKIDTSNGGLKFGFLDSSLSVFVEALETIGDTNVVASPRLTCLNKQKAEILIGSKLGYVSTTVTQTSSTQTVQFLEVGTQLRIRPFIYSDGSIRMEVHPELSTGAVRVAGGLTLPDKDVTEVTTNIMCRDGSTVVIGGLIREGLDTSGSQIPLLGNVPWVGALFRKREETVDRRELIVLITPRITGDESSSAEGDRLAQEFLNRQDTYADKMSPIGKRHFGERYLRMAQAAWSAGDAPVAFRYVNLSIHYDALNREANNLRNDIVTANPKFDESIDRRLRAGVNPVFRPRRDYSRQGYPWRPQPGDEGPPMMEDYDPGEPTVIRTIEPATFKQSLNSNPSQAPALTPAPASRRTISPQPSDEGAPVINGSKGTAVRTR